MWRRRHEEEGATLVFVAFILVVVIGAGAISVDAGALYLEHRELQNAADAAALAVAQSCAQGSTTTSCAGGMGDVDVLAEYYADPNASDRLHEAGVDLSQWSNNTVTVNTSTIESGQTPGLLTVNFARVFGINTGSPTASARARWGSPVFGSLGTLPLVISACEYRQHVGTGGGTATAPWTTTQNGSYEWLVFHGTAGDCSAVAGQDEDSDGRLSGGFGWVDTNGACAATLRQIADGTDADTDPDHEASADTGASPSQTDCPPSYIRSNLYQKVVYVPVFTDLYDVGTNGTYVISFYAAYYIAGYNFGGQYKEPSNFSCPGGGNERCIGGWFTTATAGSAQIGTGPDTGVRVYGLD